MAPSLSLYLLGPLAIETYAKTLALRYNKARALLAYLALESGFHTRESLAFLLWPEATMQSGREKLKRMLFELKEVLGGELLEGTRDVIRLRAEAGLWTDFSTFTAAIDVAQRTSAAGAPTDLDRLAQAVALYRGEFLQGLEPEDAPDFANWVQARREQCRQRYLQAIRLLAEGHEKEGDIHAAIDRVRLWTTVAPLEDAGWQYLLKLLMRAGQQDVAKQEFERYRNVLDIELGAEPDPAIEALLKVVPVDETLAYEPVFRHPERRQLTVVSCEFVVLGEPEEVVEAMRGPVAQCEALLRQASGHTVRTPSGGLLAYFGYPLAQEGSLKRAITAALACSRSVAPQEEGVDHGDIEQDHRLYVEVCLGVHTGVVISSVRDGVPDAGGVVSRLATQLGSQGITGEVIVSDASRRMLGGAFAIESAGRMYDRTQSRQINTFRVLDGDHSMMMRPNRLEVTFCGRETELSQLTRVWQQKSEHTFLVLGEAGIGKSFLIERFCAVNAVPGVTFKCSSELRQMPFHPLVHWVEELRAEAALRGDPVSAQELERHQTIQAVVELLHATPRDGSPEQWSLSSAKEMLPHRLCRLIGLHVPRGGVVHFDDAHWADPSTRELMAVMAEKPLAQRLLIVTARNEFVPPWRNYTQIEPLDLKPLDEYAITDLVQSVAGDIGLSPQLRRQIVNLSEGVPLYAEELTRELIIEVEGHAKGTGDIDTLPLSHLVPRSLHDLLMSRIDSVGRVKPIAQFAAAAGSEFTIDLLASAMHEPKTELIEAVATLLRQNLVVKLDDKRYTFRHALLREAAYQSQSKAARLEAHRLLAEVLSRDLSGSLSAPESLAWHYTRAGETKLALHYSLLAARKAGSKSASREAVGYYRNALDLFERIGDKQDCVMSELEIRMALGIQLSALHGYGSPDVVDAFRHALALAKPLGDDPRLFPIYWGLWSSASSWADFGMTAELAETLLRLARASEDSTLLTHAHYARGYSHFFFGNFDKAIADLQQCVAAYDTEQAHLALGEDALVVGLSALSICLWYAGRYDEAHVASLSAVAHARRINHRYSLVTALAIRAELYRLCGDAEQVSVVSAEAMPLARELQAPLWYEVAACGECWADAARGNASALADIALGIQQVSSLMRGLVPFFITRWVEACDLVGDVQTGLQVAARGLAAASESKDVHYLSEFQRYKGKFLFSQGQPVSVYLPWLERAVASAQACSSPPLILRAAMSLIRYGAEASSPALLGVLEQALERMQGGSTMWEVRAAKALLDAAAITAQPD